jgi:hypothetical protein
MFKLKPTNVLEHPPVGVLDLVPGENFCLIQSIDDVSCDDSASLFYFQVGQVDEDSLDFALLRLIVKYMQQNFEKDLKERQNMEDINFIKCDLCNHR